MLVRVVANSHKSDIEIEILGSTASGFTNLWKLLYWDSMKLWDFTIDILYYDSLIYYSLPYSFVAHIILLANEICDAYRWPGTQW